MAKKKKNNENRNTNSENNEDNNNEGQKKNKEGGDAEKKKEDKGPGTVILKIDMHCEGCANKIVKCVRAFEGVEAVKAETAANKLTIVGAVDPSKILDKLNQKTKKKVDLVSPQPKKDKDKDNEPKEDNKPKDKTPNDKKPKEVPVTTAVLKLGLHCNGCIEKIHKIISKNKGVIEMTVDRQKELVTVRGTMDAKALAENLKEKLKRPVEIVPPKKEKEEKDSNGRDNNSGGGSKKKKDGGGGEAGGHGGQEAQGGNSGGKMEGSRMGYMGTPGPGYGYGYGYQYQMPGGNGYDYGYPVGGYHAPQMFSDENPNACAVM